MGQATTAHVAGAEVLEVAVDTCVALVLATTVPCARHDVVTIQADAPQLLLEDLADVSTLLARAMHDVCEHRDALKGRRGTGLPLHNWRPDPEVHDSNLEAQAAEARLLGWAFVCSDSDTCPASILPVSEQHVGDMTIHSPIEEQEVAG